MQEEREGGQEESRGFEKTQQKRETQVNKLLQQMIQRKQTAVVQLEDGRKVAGVQKGGEELGKFWYNFMTSPGVTVPECEDFITIWTPQDVDRGVA